MGLWESLGQREKHILTLFALLLALKIFLVLCLHFLPLSFFQNLPIFSEVDLYHNLKEHGIYPNQRSMLDMMSDSFDSSAYLAIAQEGYKNPENLQWMFMYPAFIRLFSVFTSIKVASLLVSNLASFTAVALFYHITRGYVSADSAFKASCLFLLYPYNTVTGVLSYSEPLFTVFLLASWIFFQKNKLVYCGAFMLLASLTRFPGILLFPLITFIYLIRNRTNSNALILLRSSFSLNSWLCRNV